MPSSCKAYCGMDFNTIVPVCPPRQAFCPFSLLSFLSFFFFFFFLSFFCFPCGFFFYDVDGDMDTRTLFDDFLMQEILAGRFDDFLTTNFLTIFLFEDLSGRRTSRYRRRPAAAGFFFSLNASSGLLATRRRPGRRGDSSTMRSAFVV